MRTIWLDAAEIGSRRTLHRMLAEKLEFPEWYGGNLDALYDCLSDIREDTRIGINGCEQLEEQLGGYASVFFRVLREASEENSHLEIVFD